MNRINAQTRRFATAAAVGALALANNAHAAIDVTGVVSEINDTIAPIGLIGACWSWSWWPSRPSSGCAALSAKR